MTDSETSRAVPYLLAAVCLLVAVLAGAACVFIRREPLAVVAPFLGPWGGVACGHLDCTLGNTVPVVSWSVVAFGIVAWAMMVVARGSTARIVGGILVVLWALAWSALAVLSVLNSTS